LIAQNFIFPDGILVEKSSTSTEETLLVSETIQFRILRLNIGGNNAGEWSIVQENLPGMPDGMDRDADGRIWVGIIKQRSPVIDWIHGHPWIKPFLLRLPADLMPVSAETSVMAFSKDGSTPLFYSLHDGSVLSDISVVVPGGNELFVAAFNREATGLFRMPYPLGLEPAETN
jgi:sugar lactone lactonase YvrE